MGQYPPTGQQPQQQSYVAPPKTNTLAIISLVAGLAGLLVTWVIPFVSQIVAIVCGHIARSQIRKSNGAEGGSGMALTGLIIGYVMLGISMLFILLLGGLLTGLFLA